MGATEAQKPRTFRTMVVSSPTCPCYCSRPCSSCFHWILVGAATGSDSMNRKNKSCNVRAASVLEPLTRKSVCVCLQGYTNISIRPPGAMNSLVNVGEDQMKKMIHLPVLPVNIWFQFSWYLHTFPSCWVSLTHTDSSSLPFLGWKCVKSRTCHPHTPWMCLPGRRRNCSVTAASYTLCTSGRDGGGRRTKLREEPRKQRTD